MNKLEWCRENCPASLKQCSNHELLQLMNTAWIDFLKSEPRRLNAGPYYPFKSTDEYTLSVSMNMGSYDDPQVEVFFEEGHPGGFYTVRLIIPDQIVIVSDWTGESYGKFWWEHIQPRMYDMICYAEEKGGILDATNN